ncbi:unnamed protein product [Lasius platythorax]|uniref:Uncharacterized protein n=1 Tax=Lasius platythorax TaxID=488582 RepID=A0AAV2NR24_9HYME
MQFYVHDLAEV